jgi:hypothetical protein
VSSFVPGGGQTAACARIVKNAAKRPEKNMNSEPSQIMTPTASSCGRRGWTGAADGGVSSAVTSVTALS